MANIQLAILLVLHERKEIHGTDTLAMLINADQTSVTRHALLLAKTGMIMMERSNGGRAKKTIYRDNGVIKVTR